MCFIIPYAQFVSDLIEIPSEIERRINALSWSRFVGLTEKLGLRLSEFNESNPPAKRLLTLRENLTSAEIGIPELIRSLELITRPEKSKTPDSSESHSPETRFIEIAGTVLAVHDGFHDLKRRFGV